MRLALNVFIMIIFLLIQSTTVNFLQIGSIKPDISLVFVMCIAMFKGEKTGAFIGFLNGLIEDMLYGRVLGFNALARLLTGYAIGFGTKNIFKGPVLITMGIVLIGSLFHSIIFVLLGYILKQTSNPWYFFMPIIVPSAFLNMIISPFIYYLVSKLESFFDYYFNIKY